MINYLKKLPNALRSFFLEPSSQRSAQSLRGGKWFFNSPRIRQQLKKLKESNVHLTHSVYQSFFMKGKRFLQKLKKMSRALLILIISMPGISSVVFGATHNHPNNIKFWNNHELVVFYKSSCAHCKQFGPVLHSIIKTMHIPTVNFTLDDGLDPNYQNTAPMLPLLQSALNQLVASRVPQDRLAVALLSQLAQGNQANNLPLIFLVSNDGSTAFVSSGVMRSDRWLQQLLSVMQQMAQAEKVYA